jgi:hypothetical protein
MPSSSSQKYFTDIALVSTPHVFVASLLTAFAFVSAQDPDASSEKRAKAPGCLKHAVPSGEKDPCSQPNPGCSTKVRPQTAQKPLRGQE